MIYLCLRVNVTKAIDTDTNTNTYGYAYKREIISLGYICWYQTLRIWKFYRNVGIGKCY